MTTELAPETLAPIECASWCEDGNGHTDEVHPDDQRCHLWGGEVRLHTRMLVAFDRGATRRLDRIYTSMSRGPGRADLVTITDETHNCDQQFTIAEAEELVGVLQNLIDRSRA